MSHYGIGNNLCLVSVNPPPPSAGVLKPTRTNHVLVIDCSGSMSYDLPRIRDQVKAKLPKILAVEDTVSIIWFSGRGECGVLLEGEKVASLTDLQTVNAAVDRWLKPVGLTGFKEPLQLAIDVSARLRSKHGGAVSLFFMSDGCDNQWSRLENLSVAGLLGTSVDSATFVEYGYYADRQLLAAMAEKCGGSTIFAQDFDQYAPSFEAAMKKTSSPAKVSVPIGSDPVGGFAFALYDDDLLAFAIDSNHQVQVPADVDRVFYLTPNNHTVVTNMVTGRELPAIYAAMSLYALRMQSNVVYDLLKETGDVNFIEQFSGCFGKQKYSEFMEATKKAAFDGTLRYAKGLNHAAVPNEDAFTVLDLLNVLASDEENRVLLDSKEFKYSKISRSRVDANSVLTDEEQAEVARLTAAMSSSKDVEAIKQFAEKLKAITEKKKGVLQFELHKEEHGYPISTLVYNEEQPNVSMLVKKFGHVDISSRKGNDPNLASLPNIFSTFIYRNYAIIKDGLVNVERLPARLTAGTIRDLKKRGMPVDVIVGFEGETDEVARRRATKASSDRMVNVVFDLKKLPIINRKMVKEASAKVLFEKEWELLKAQAAAKVFNAYKKEKFPKTSAGFATTYGKLAEEWLKEQGITEFSGFGPKMVQVEAKDFYMAKKLVTSLKGYSSLPSLKEVRDKYNLGKALTGGGELMLPHVLDMEKGFHGPNHEEWLTDRARETTANARRLIAELARIKFAVTVGQVWFSEFKSLDENTMTITVDGKTIDCKVEQAEVQVKI